MTNKMHWMFRRRKKMKNEKWKKKYADGEKIKNWKCQCTTRKWWTYARTALWNIETSIWIKMNLIKEINKNENIQSSKQTNESMNQWIKNLNKGNGDGFFWWITESYLYR